MNVLFLLGRDLSHGVNRYADSLGGFIASSGSGVDALFEYLDFNGIDRNDYGLHIREILNKYDDIVGLYHLQFSRELYGCLRNGVSFVRQFICMAKKPVVLTIHDVYLSNAWCKVFGLDPVVDLGERGESSSLVNVIRCVNRLRSRVVSELLWVYFVKRVLPAATSVVVCQGYEKKMLSALSAKNIVHQIPHFARDDGVNRCSMDLAKRRLGFADHVRVVGVAGWISYRKGHFLVAQSLKYLPENVVVCFIGGATSGVGERCLAECKRYVEENGLSDRLCVTGYLDDNDVYKCYMASCSVAVCAFEKSSASGSLSEWISIGKPVVASNLPLVHEYNDYSNGHLFSVFEPYTPESLANAIRQQLDTGSWVDYSVLIDTVGCKAVARQHCLLYKRLTACHN